MRSVNGKERSEAIRGSKSRFQYFVCLERYERCFSMSEKSVFSLFPALHIFRSLFFRPLLFSSHSPTRRYFNPSVDRRESKSFARQQHLLMHQRKRKGGTGRNELILTNSSSVHVVLPPSFCFNESIHPFPFSYDPIPIRNESQNRKGMERKKKENTT